MLLAGELHDLLLDLFGADELRSFLFKHCGDDLLTALPGREAPHATLVLEAVRGLKGRGLIDRGLFDALALERPNRATEIEQVRLQWIRPATLDRDQLWAGGRYRLVSDSGHGGTAQVWKALDTGTNSHVALRILQEQHCNDRRHRLRFARGADVLARLRHPAIVRVRTGVEQEASRLYYVMEFVHGETLDALVDSRPRPELLGYLLQIGDALAHVHDHDLLHRDVKPGNILVSRRGQATLIDFDLVAGDTFVQMTTHALGTAYYAPPEAHTRDEKTPAYDVFSLARTVEYVLRGRESTIAEFTARDSVGALDCSNEVKAVLRAALQPDPGRRTRTVRQFCADLEAALRRPHVRRADPMADGKDTEFRAQVDAQLREVGWEADSTRLSHASGARPEDGKDRAIAAWPTDEGTIDYALFLGQHFAGLVMLTTRAGDVGAALEVAQRLAQGRPVEPALLLPHSPWDAYRVPFLFASDGRPHHGPLRTMSGVWHWDARLPEEPRRSIAGWLGPASIRTRLLSDPGRASARLAAIPPHTSFLRGYQREAILGVEAALARGERRSLITMASGTGLTRTAVHLLYRQLVARRFGRILFLTDRDELGEQTFHEMRSLSVEGSAPLASLYDIRGPRDREPLVGAGVRVSSLRNLDLDRTRRSRKNGQPVSDPGAYDCIVVSECHRTLDSLGDDPLSNLFDRFDAVAIGLTALPTRAAVRTFGSSLFSYSYARAVEDGILVPGEVHDITPQGVRATLRYDKSVNGTIPDEIFLEDAPGFDLETFDRSTSSESWIHTVCTHLSREIDPRGPAKTLIFAANSDQAAKIAAALKQSYQERGIDLSRDAIAVITNSTSKAADLVHRFKAMPSPTIAVLVNPWTGISVPKVCNLVFMRRVRSPASIEQMIAMGTRTCPDIDKHSLRIFDAVGLYDTMFRRTPP